MIQDHVLKGPKQNISILPGSLRVKGSQDLDPERYLSVSKLTSIYSDVRHLNTIKTMDFRE